MTATESADPRPSIASASLPIKVASTVLALLTFWVTTAACLWVVGEIRGSSDWAIERDLASHPFAISALLMSLAVPTGLNLVGMLSAREGMSRSPHAGMSGLALRYASVDFLGRMVLAFAITAGFVWAMGSYNLHVNGDGALSWLTSATVGHPFTTAAIIMTLSWLLAVAAPVPAPEAIEEAGPHGTPFDAAIEALAGPAPDVPAARTLLDAARRDGDPRAAHALAGWHALGLGVPRDPAAAFALLREAAAAGSMEAGFDLAVAHELGEGTEPDATEAYQLYLAAALAGYPRAGAEVARCLESGIGVAADHRAAATWRSGRPVRPQVSRPWPWNT